MNYLAMRQDFVSLLNRTDCTDASSALVKGWFDKSIARCQRELRLPSMEKIIEVNTDTGDVDTLTLPNDWMETKSFLYTLANGEADEILPLELGTFYRRRSQTQFGYPTYYTRKGSNWLIADPLPQGCTAELVYYAQLDALVSDTDEPVLAAIAPDLIVYGALTYSSDYFTDDRAATWEQKWQEFREQLQSQAAEGDNHNGANAIQAAYDLDDGIA